MPRYLLKGTICAVLILFVYGCGVSSRTYVQVRERLDQERSGNAGYLLGNPPEDETKQYRKTRKVYVMEFSKEAPQNLTDMYTQTEDSPRSISVDSRQRRKKPTRQPPIVIPDFDEVKTPPSRRRGSEPDYIDYTVKKNDTLQKISKEFYNGYSKWPRIYEANKDKIKNPDRLKPGLVIRIPMK